ncbi:MAG TPA: helix-turn-helix domain-containing protein [Geomonas sp.]
MGKLSAPIQHGLEQAIPHDKGAKPRAPAFMPEEVKVKTVREKTGLTQAQFAATFGISLGTLRHWERGDRKPQGPALVLLNAANNAPDVLLRILSGKALSRKIPPHKGFV